MYSNQIEKRKNGNELGDIFTDIWNKVEKLVSSGGEKIEGVQKTAENLNKTAQELMAEGKQAMKILKPAMIILGVELAVLLLFSDLKLSQEIKWKELV